MTNTEQSDPRHPVARVVEGLTVLSALFGGAVLLAIVGLVCTSIVLRSLGFNPIQGDFELLQVGLAICVGAFLPYCHLKGGNIFVDFFTARARRRTQRRLDAVGGVLVALVMALVAWRTGAGAISLKEAGEVTMIRGFPVWVSYALMTPGFALTAIAALYGAWHSWRKARHE